MYDMFFKEIHKAHFPYSLLLQHIATDQNQVNHFKFLL